MSIRDYKITDEQFNEKGMTSLPDTLKGTPYENKKSLEKFTREVVAPQFNAIVDNFADMEESANNWSAEEAQRVQQENARQSAEQGRVSAEGQRATNETARLLAEENRVTAETARVNAENGRVSAEAGRRAGEKARNVWEMYSASKAYVPGNKVSFGGSSYVCTAATVGHEPTDTAYWLLIAQKGMDGAGADDLRQINNALDAIDPTKITTKAEPADGDGVMIADSADGGKAKRLLWSNVKAALGKLFVPLARKINGKTLSADVTLTGENIAVSTTDSTPISGAVKYRTNPNLLDNWFFGRPVNQRGQTEWTNANDHAIDRWKLAGGGKISLVDGGIKCEDVYLHQFFEKGFWGKGTYTISVLTKNPSGNFSGAFGFWGAGVDKGFSAALDNGFATATFTVTENHDDYNPFIYLGLNNTFLAAKLELGDTQTLAHKENGVWVLNEIPDYGEQLRRCQLYRWRFCPAEYVGSAIAFGISANAARALIYLPEQMRTNPTLNFNKNTGLFLTGVDGDIYGVTLALVWTSPNSICVEFQKSGAFAPNSVYFVRGDGSSAIDISADL